MFFILIGLGKGLGELKEKENYWVWVWGAAVGVAERLDGSGQRQFLKATLVQAVQAHSGSSGHWFSGSGAGWPFEPMF